MKYTNAYPKYQFRRITDITVEDLQKMGVKAVAVDLDNTTVIDSSYKLPEETRKWIETVREAGIQVIIISNTWFTRAWYLGKKMGVPFIAPAHKPHTRAIRKAAKMLGVELENLAMIGDQLFTDVLGANLFGLTSILTDWIDPHEMWGTSHIARPLERWVQRRWAKTVRRKEE